jgi:hypothetical protein
MSCTLSVAVGNWVDLPPTDWQGNLKAEVTGIKNPMTAIVGYPARDASPLAITSAQELPAGVYEVRLTLRPSHVAGSVAFNSGLKVKSDNDSIDLPGQFFARVHQPETRIIKIVKNKTGSINLRLSAFTDALIFQNAQRDAKNKNAGGNVQPDDPEENNIDEELGLSPASSFYYLLDKAEYRVLSQSGCVTRVNTDKIRYNPGDTLKGTVALTDTSGKGSDGILNLYLEHNLNDRVKIKSLPIKLTAEPQILSFDAILPKEELGYALVGEFVSIDGKDRDENAEYFNIAKNFNRVALFGGGAGSTRDVTLDDETVRKAVSNSRSEYYNACEYFAWAEDDMVEMSSDGDYWFSGQTNYHMNKQTIQKQIRLAHEQGISMVTYGKFVMSGYPGWKTAYDYPSDHRSQYYYPVGMWEGVNSTILDRFRNKETVPYSPLPTVPGNSFYVWWQEFMPINPDATPRMSRIAAEEVIRSIDMFGWDGIRWDGHPRGGGQCGSNGNYDQSAARRTQSLVRYFKDIVGAKYPNFGHGYNYLLIEPKKDYSWAVEDFELDELCRGGGLLMNESIGNASAGWTFDTVVRNLQVEGDLCRERGGYYLGISFAKSPRDVIIESALWAASGTRPYTGAMNKSTRRYCTRYSQYTLDENLRRLTTPEKILTPQTETKLWWQPFVYETPLTNGKRQMVVNLLNIPRQAKRPPRDGEVKPEWDMPVGTDPVTFALTLPAGIRAISASMIDPRTLEIVPLTLKDNQLQIPAIAIWNVVIIDLAVDANAPSLSSLYGSPKTFGVLRPDLKNDRKPEVLLDPKREIWEVNKDMSVLAPDWSTKNDEEQKAIDALGWDEHNAAVLKRREKNTADEYIKAWWHGGSLPADLKLKDNTIAFGDLTPRRNGRFDIYYGRGAMDYRLRMPAIFAGLDKFSIYDAPQWGALKQSPNMGIGGNMPWSRYPEFDSLLFTGIPHCAIGAENAYGMVEYVKAGGSVFFTGGEYAFGKGGYQYTVLERDLLPVICVEAVDTRVSAAPLPLESGKDFAELKFKADFSAKPAFWVWNQVALKNDPNIKIFLKSGNRPILVGWQVGKGRVACLLIDHRGKSEKDVTAFFDWTDWPGLSRAVFAWLTPDAGKVDKKVLKADLPDLLKTLAEETATDVSIKEVKSNDEPGDVEEVVADDAGMILDDKTLKRRIPLLKQVLQGEGADAGLALAEQSIKVGNLPESLRQELIDFASRNRPGGKLEEIAAPAVTSASAVARNAAIQLLGMANGTAFLKVVKNPPHAEDVNLYDRDRAIAFGVLFCRTTELADEGKLRVKRWNDMEKQVIDKWTNKKGFSLATPEHPGIDAEALFQRVAWLAYLSRIDAKSYGAQFAREWLMTAEYQDYCDRTTSNLWSDGMSPFEKKRAIARGEEWGQLRGLLGRLREATRPDIEALIKTQPDAVGEGFRLAHFTLEFRTAMNLLGSQDAKVIAAILEKLKTAENTDLAEFANARLGAVAK